VISEEVLAMTDKQSTEAFGSIGVELESLRFFEWAKDIPPEEHRRYTTRFPHQTTRFVYVAVDIHNKLYKQRDQTYQVIARCHQPDGSLVGNTPRDYVIKAEWEGALLYWAWGQEEPGSWSPGTYRVEILIDGAYFSEGLFTIE
jgi:hypothetical protein